MKKITGYFKLVAVLVAFFSATVSYSQCAANFTWTIGSNGAVTFTSTSTPTTGSTTYYWNFGNGATSTVSAPNNTASANFFANGIYSVQLHYNTGTCSNTAVYTLNITNVTTPTCNIAAMFAAQPGSNGNTPFINQSTGTVSACTYTWDYGDGSATSNAIAPAHTYTANGSYTVTLQANNNYTPTCASTYSAAVTVTSVCSMTASYIYTVGAGGLISFTSTSTGTNSSCNYSWLTGGSTVLSGTNAQQGSYTFPNNGTYVFTLTVNSNIAPFCSASVINIVTVTTAGSPTCTLNAGFNYTQNAGTASFNNTTTGTSSGTTWQWDFGDGSTSTLQNPSHTYTANGLYTAQLIANNNFTPACTSTVSYGVFINSICNLSAGFNYTLGSNGMVSFGNLTTGTLGTNYTWNFGDGSSNSNAVSPIYTYTTNGTYTVMLSAVNPSAVPVCQNSVTAVVTVTSSTCTANSGFSMVPTATAQYWYAVPASTTNIANAVWSWGDGSTSTGLFSSHTYSAAGLYTLCLSVTVTCGATSTSCYTYNIYRSSEDNTIIQVDVKTAEEIALGIGNNSVKDMAYTVSPNPNNGTFRLNISGLSAKAQVDVYNIIGELVYTSENETANGSLVKDIDLDKTYKGVYFVKVSSDNKVYTKKLIINK